MAELTEGSPEYTAEQVEQFIKSQVELHKDEIIKGYEASRPAAQPQRPPPQAVSDREQQRELERNYVLHDIGLGNDLNQLRYVAADAVDQVRFYRQHPEMVEFEPEIEAAFQEAGKNGRPTAREHLADWITGREMRLNPDKYQERRTRMHKQAVADVADAIDVAAHAAGKTRAEYTALRDFGKTDDKGNFLMKTDEMEKALEGLSI